VWPKHQPPAGGGLASRAGVTPSGSLEAIDHMAAWVRFADTKATVLAAGLGVVVTMLASSTSTVVKALGGGCGGKMTVGGLALITALAFLWTLFWLVRAIAPRNRLPYNGLNRFAWPSLVGATAEQLVAHAAASDVEVDAWQQVVDLAGVAREKFDAVKHAVYGFGLLIVVGVFTVVCAAAFAR
jgi:hypothetical protein